MQLKYLMTVLILVELKNKYPKYLDRKTVFNAQIDNKIAIVKPISKFHTVSKRIKIYEWNV